MYVLYGRHGRHKTLIHGKIAFVLGKAKNIVRRKPNLHYSNYGIFVSQSKLCAKAKNIANKFMFKEFGQ